MIDLVEVEKERLLDEVSPLCVVLCFLSLTEIRWRRSQHVGP